MHVPITQAAPRVLRSPHHVWLVRQVQQCAVHHASHPHPHCSLLSHAESDLDVTLLLEPPADRQSKDEHERLMRGFCKGLSRSHQAPKMRSQYDFYLFCFADVFFCKLLVVDSFIPAFPLCMCLKACMSATLCSTKQTT